MTDITIPREALEAGKDSAFAWLRSFMEDDLRVQNMTDEELSELVEAACLAMLRNWPGMGTVATEDHAGVWRQIILPLRQESIDE